VSGFKRMREPNYRTAVEWIGNRKSAEESDNDTNKLGNQLSWKDKNAKKVKNSIRSGN